MSGKEPYARQLSVAKEAALKAGELIRTSRDRAQAKVKSGVDLVTEVDEAAEELVTSIVKDAFPSDEIIGEEAQAENASGSQGEAIPDGNVWCVARLTEQQTSCIAIHFIASRLDIAREANPEWVLFISPLPIVYMKLSKGVEHI